MATQHPQNPNSSLLAALCLSGVSVEVQGNKFTIYELESQMVGLLLLEMESAANAGVAVISLLSPNSGEMKEYFKSSWWKIGAAAQDVVFTLLAFSLGEVERNEQQVPKAILDNVRKLPVSYIVPLLQGIAEANQSFFDGLRDGMETLTQKAPGLSSALKGAFGMQSEESDSPNPNPSEPAMDGQPASQPLSAAAGQS